MLSTPDLKSIEPVAASAIEVEVPILAVATPEKPSIRQELQIFTSTFLAVLLAELGDKTQVTTLLMSAQAQAPWVVFVGAGAALVTTSLIGVLLGQWVAQRVSAKTLEISTGVLLLLISALMLGDILCS